MFFLLRMAFWLTLVLVLLPSGSAKPDAQATAKVDPVEAVVAAGATVSDVSSFCDRQPDACVVGTQAAVVLGQRAQAGAKMVYEFINEHWARGTTGSVSEPKIGTLRAVPASPGSQTTLKPADLDPTWQGPAPRAEAVPLPRPRRAADTRRGGQSG